MKNLKKSVIALLCLMMACLTLSGCAKTSSQIEAEQQEKIQAENLQDVRMYTENYFANTMKSATYEQYKQYVEQGSTLAGYTFDNDWGARWALFVENHGEVKEAEVPEKLIERTHTGFTGRVILTGEDGGQMILSVFYDEALRPVKTQIGEYSDDSKETLASKMATAGSNTITGLIVVFFILVFLSLIISCFKFLNKTEVKPQKKDAPKAQAAAPAAAPAPAVSAEEIDLAKNQELVAVIMAAIAASEEENTSGYVVRSIKRLRTNKWR